MPGWGEGKQEAEWGWMLAVPVCARILSPFFHLFPLPYSLLSLQNGKHRGDPFEDFSYQFPYHEKSSATAFTQYGHRIQSMLQRIGYTACWHRCINREGYRMGFTILCSQSKCSNLLHMSPHWAYGIEDEGENRRIKDGFYSKEPSSACIFHSQHSKNIWICTSWSTKGMANFPWEELNM